MLPIRTFIAVDVAPAVASRIVRLIGELQQGRASVKWVTENNLHLTLQFLGDVEPTVIPDIGHALEQAAAEVEPFEMVCHGIGAFPNLERPRTLWLGVESGADEMCDLQGRVEKALKPLGFRPEARKFHPHLTIGRVKRSHPRDIAEMLEGRQDFHAGATHIAEVVLYSSQLEREGPTYTVLSTAPLGA
jgi:2'-5' RNA ligase